METIKLQFPSKPQYVSMLRLTTSSIASAQGFDVEVIEDLKVCISEAVNDLIALNEVIDVEFHVGEEMLTMTISYANGLEDDNGDASLKTRRQMRRLILESLMDGVEETGNSVTLTKKQN